MGKFSSDQSFISPQAILDQLPEAVLVLNTEGIVTAWNSAAEGFWNHFHSENLVEGLPLLELSGTMASFWKKWIQRLYRRGCFEETVTLNPLDSSVAESFILQASSLNNDHWMFRFETRSRHLCKVESLEREILNQKEALLARDTLLSIIGHDLRAPIFQLNSLLYMLRQEIETLDRRRVEIYANDLEERIFYLTNSLENLLRWAGLRRDKLSPLTTTFNLRQIIDESVGFLKAISEAKGLTIRCEGELNLTLETDQEMLSLVLRNLIANAIKFSPQEGEIEIKASVEGDGLVLSIKDYGIGIESENISRILNPQEFFTKSGSHGEQGTGIGLKLSMEFLEKLGGRLEIQSQPHTYTEVAFWIPCSLKRLQD